MFDSFTTESNKKIEEYLEVLIQNDIDRKVNDNLKMIMIEDIRNSIVDRFKEVKASKDEIMLFIHLLMSYNNSVSNIEINQQLRYQLMNRCSSKEESLVLECILNEI
jgi:hypothetical protein